MSARDSRPARQTVKVTQLLGMNTTDPVVSLLPGQAEVIENIDLILGGLGIKRSGFSAGPTAGTEPQGIAGSTLVHLFRHVPGGNDASAELWAVTRANTGGVITLSRYASGTWSTIALADAAATGGSGFDWSMVTFNGKLFIAYDSAVNRLHVWDGTSVRRVGLAPPASAPGLASIGAGALSFTRFYRVRFRASINGTALVSEPSPSASITIAASSGVRVTRPATVDGNEQGWDVEAATSAAGPWFVIAGSIAIGTTTFDDTSATISTTVPSAELGLYTLPPSCKYLSIYRNQILMGGAWETSAIAGQTLPQNNRVWFTRVLHSLDISDDESVPNTLSLKYWVDLGEDNDRVNGLSMPLEGMPYVTKQRQVWALNPTDDVDVPFRTIQITTAVGCRDYRTLVVGEDEGGNPALYWNSLRGPYRLGRAGLQYIGRDLQQFSAGAANVGLTEANRATWFAEQRQVWFGASTDTEGVFFVFNAQFGQSADGMVRNGWTRYRLASPQSIFAMATFAESFVLTNATLQPVIGGITLNTPTSTLWQRQTTGAQDNSVSYRGYVRTSTYPLGQFLYNAQVYPPRVYAQPRLGSSSITLTCDVTRNFDALSTPQTSSVTLTTLPGVQWIGTFEGIGWSDGEVYRFEIGDASAMNQGWSLIAFMVPYERAEEAE